MIALCDVYRARRLINSHYLSPREGRLVSTDYAKTIAEGLATARAYELPFEILGSRINGEMLRAIKEFITTRQVAEPAGAAALAAVIKLRNRLICKKVMVIAIGGNVDPELLKKIIEGY